MRPATEGMAQGTDGGDWRPEARERRPATTGRVPSRCGELPCPEKWVKCPPYTTGSGGFAMIPHHVYYQLALLGLLWLCVLRHYGWPSRSATVPQWPAAPITARRKRSNA